MVEAGVPVSHVVGEGAQLRRHAGVSIAIPRTHDPLALQRRSPSTSCRATEVAFLRVSTELVDVTPDIRTIEFTPEDTDDGEMTPEWLMGVAEGLQEDREKLPPGSEITRVEITIVMPE